MVAADPDAKFILTQRNADTWYESVKSTVIKANAHPLLPVLTLLGPDFVRKWKPLVAKMAKGFFRGSFEKNGKQVFWDHYDKIRCLVPRDRFLGYKVGEVWDGLYKFLGDNILKEPFLNLNETATFHVPMEVMRRRRL